MTDVNQISITGRLTANAEMKNVGEKAVFSGSIAVNHYNKKENKEEADFFNFNLWANSSKQAEYYQSVLIKGTPVLFIGSISQQKWTDKEGKGQNRVVINASNVNLMQSGKKGGSGANNSVPEDDFPIC